MTFALLRRRLRKQDGFTLVVALSVLTIVMLVTGALAFTVQSDAGLTRADLNGKQAYAAAQAGAQAYLADLNGNATSATWWQTCANDTGSGTVPGNSGETYTYSPVGGCSPSSPIGTVLDPTTGQLRIEFTGKAGTATRTMVVAYRTLSPLSYLWYTVYETVDPGIGGASCARFYWATPQPPASCQIQWITGDVMNGPMYSQDNFLVSGTPHFGSVISDSIASSAPTASVCVGANGGATSQETCPSGVLIGTQDPGAPYIPLPTDNSNLEADSASMTVPGVLTGTTTLTITGSSATAVTCTSSKASGCSTKTFSNLAQTQVIYVANGSGCTTAPSYDPTNVGAPATVTYKGTAYDYGTCGDVYLQGSFYSAPLTIAAEDDIVVQGDVIDQSNSNGTPTGTATLGLIADQYVRVYHPVTSGSNTCANPDRTIDAAILTLKHSFFVDNYDCGTSSGYGTLTVNGAIAQEYRGIVGESGGRNGYLKDYSYDHRLSYLLPPYMFDLQDSAWGIVRQTLCSLAAASSSPQSCAYTGTTS